MLIKLILILLISIPVIIFGIQMYKDVRRMEKSTNRKYTGICPQCSAETEILYSGIYDQIREEHCEYCEFEDVEIY